MKITRLQRIVGEYFMPYNRTIADTDVEYVMEFLRVLLIAKKKYVRFDETGRREK